MKIGILGTGVVGQTIGTKFAELGHEVKMGARSADNARASQWAASAGEKASQGTFADAARFGEIVFNCTSGTGSLAAAAAALLAYMGYQFGDATAVNEGLATLERTIKDPDSAQAAYLNLVREVWTSTPEKD